MTPDSLHPRSALFSGATGQQRFLCAQPSWANVGFPKGTNRQGSSEVHPPNNNHQAKIDRYAPDPQNHHKERGGVEEEKGTT